MKGQISFSMIIDNQKKLPKYKQLEDYIKYNIKSGNFISDSRLPSIREAALSLGISKTSIENAYSQLVVEGYIENRPQKGYFVSQIADYEFEGTFESKVVTNIYKKQKYLNNGVGHKTLDLQLIKKLYAKVVLEEDMTESGDIQGEYVLRKEISEFVNKMRGGNTSWEQVIVGAGTQYLLGILVGIIGDKKVIIEDPGFKKAEYIFQDYKLNIEKIQVNEDGLSMVELRRFSEAILYISPSHQYPLGSVMPIGQRLELLNWAEESNSFIIEDDYDGVIRYDGNPIPCLQGLDKKDEVIYLGSFSKTFSPSLRVSYMIIPTRLLTEYQRIKHRYTQSTSRVDQLVVARFIEGGHMSKHLRKIRRLYKRKNQLLLELINEKFEDKIKVINADSGFHLSCESISEVNGESFKNRCEKLGLIVDIVSEHMGGKRYKILYSFNYSGIENDQMEEALDIIAKGIC